MPHAQAVPAARPARAARQRPNRPSGGCPAAPDLAALGTPPRPTPGDRPLPALKVAPRLDGVTSFITQVDVDAAHARYAAAQANDPTPLVTPLFGTALPDPGAEGTLEERLTRALEQAAPFQQVQLAVHNKGGALVFDAEAPQDGVIALPSVHAALHRVDPHVLPGVLCLLESLTARVLPVLGPKGVSEGIVEYWWSLDQLRDAYLPERLAEGHTDRIWSLPDREVVRIARRLGLPHAWSIEESYPHTYFRDVPGREATLQRLEAAVPHFPGLAALPGLLRELITHADALPELTWDEEGEVPGGVMPTFVVTTDPSPHCLVWEAADEYVRNHWEGGEDHPQVRLNIGTGAADHARLAAYLRHAPEVERLTLRVIDLLTGVEETLPTPKARKRKVR